MSRQWLRLLDPRIHELQQHAGDSPDSRLQYIRALNGRCMHEDARAILDGCRNEDRNDPDLWFERIMALGDHASSGEMADLFRQLSALREEHPQDAPVLRNLGFIRLLQQRLDEAERVLRQSLTLNGADPRALELMGLLCVQRENSQEAKTWLLKALSLQPRDPRTLRLLGITCEHLGDFKCAESQFLAALEMDAFYFWGWHSLGELLLKKGEMEDGLRCIHRARSIQAKESASYFILSELFAEQGHLELAMAELHHLTALSPALEVLAEAYAMLGEIRRDLGDQEGATSYFSLATETDPQAADPWAALGDMARTDCRWEDALRCYREALTRKPDAADLQVQMGYILLNTGQYSESEQLFLTALEADPSEYSAYLGLSECYRNLQRPEDQFAMVKQALALAPDDPDVWNALGVAQEVRGKCVEATEAYERALSLAPLHRKAANNLGFLLEKRMQAGEADLRNRAMDAWKLRLLICRDEGQSMKKATEHLAKLGVSEETIRWWLEHDPTPGS
ncbi:MAG: tetratricopeptide repeat protein [Holophaga sp.]|nr:tetratricopeptide repeat protein [Holophaga sp.]